MRLNRFLFGALACFAALLAPAGAARAGPGDWEYDDFMNQAATQAVAVMPIWLVASCGATGPTSYNLTVQLVNNGPAPAMQQVEGWNSLLAMLGDVDGIPGIIRIVPSDGSFGRTVALERAEPGLYHTLSAQLTPDELAALRSASAVELTMMVLGENSDPITILVPFGATRSSNALKKIQCVQAPATPSNANANSKAPFWAIGDVIDFAALGHGDETLGWYDIYRGVAGRFHSVAGYEVVGTSRRVVFYLTETTRTDAAGGVAAGRVVAQTGLTLGEDEYMSYDCAPPGTGSAPFVAVAYNPNTRQARGLVLEMSGKPRFVERNWIDRTGSCEYSGD